MANQPPNDNRPIITDATTPPELRDIQINIPMVLSSASGEVNNALIAFAPRENSTNARIQREKAYQILTQASPDAERVLTELWNIISMGNPPPGEEQLPIYSEAVHLIEQASSSFPETQNELLIPSSPAENPDEENARVQAFGFIWRTQRQMDGDIFMKYWGHKDQAPKDLALALIKGVHAASWVAQKYPDPQKMEGAIEYCFSLINRGKTP